MRRPRREEAGAVADLAADADVAFGASPALTRDMIQRFWARPRFSLNADAWVVESAQGLAGYAETWDMEPGRVSAYALVHPAHTRRGIGTFLAERIEERSAELARGESKLYSAVASRDDAGATLLEARGYRFARRFRHMHIDLEGSAPVLTTISGIDIRPLERENDLPAAYRVLESAFADHWDFAPTTYEEFLERNVRNDDFDPSLWLIAFDRDEPVGALYAVAESDRGWISELGVLRSYRGRGIASAMLARSFAEFGRRGLPRVGLSVDSDSLTNAAALYERLGMREVLSFDLWELDLPEPAAG